MDWNSWKTTNFLQRYILSTKFHIAEVVARSGGRNITKLLSIFDTVVTGKMKLAQTIQKNLSSLGIRDDRLFQTHPFNQKNVLILISNGLFVTLHIIYLFCVARTFKEYTISFYMTTAAIVILLACSILIWKSKNLFQLIKSSTKIIEKSE